VIRVLGMSVTEAWMFGGVALVSGLLELAALIWPDRFPVITRVMRADGRLWTLWPFLLGFIPGHIYGPGWLRVEALQRAQPWAVPLILAAVVTCDLLVQRTSVETAFLVLVASVFAGAVFWNTSG
jgi:hypothetical protein